MASITRPGLDGGTDEPANRTPAQIEADIAYVRKRLAVNLDELTDRVNPRSVARRTSESVRGQIDTALESRPPLGVLIGVGAVAIALVGVVVWRRRR